MVCLDVSYILKVRLVIFGGHFVNGWLESEVGLDVTTGEGNAAANGRMLDYIAHRFCSQQRF